MKSGLIKSSRSSSSSRSRSIKEFIQQFNCQPTNQQRQNTECVIQLETVSLYSENFATGYLKSHNRKPSTPLFSVPLK